MSDRNLREQSNAQNQRIAALERQVRALNLRAWQGAVRSVDVTSFTPSVINTFDTVASVTVSTGRWIVLASAWFIYPGLTTGNVFPRIEVQVLDPDTGLAPPGLVKSRMFGGFTSPLQFENYAHVPVVLGDFTSPEVPAEVILTTRDAGGLDYEIQDAFLRCLPT